MADTLDLALSAMLKTYLIRTCQNLQLKADMKVHEVADYTCRSCQTNENNHQIASIT